MNSHPVKSLSLFATLLVTSFFVASAKAEQAKTMPLPKPIIKTIQNNTPYNLLLVDRLVKNNSVILPAGKTIEVNFRANGQHKVIINGNMSECMAKDAQYVFKKLDQNGNPELDQEVYYNLHMAGTNELFHLDLYGAGKNGGCTLRGHTVNAGGGQTVKFDLELSVYKEYAQTNLFKMKIEGNYICQ